MLVSKSHNGKGNLIKLSHTLTMWKDTSPIQWIQESDIGKNWRSGLANDVTIQHRWWRSFDERSHINIMLDGSSPFPLSGVLLGEQGHEDLKSLPTSFLFPQQLLRSVDRDVLVYRHLQTQVDVPDLVIRAFFERHVDCAGSISTVCLGRIQGTAAFRLEAEASLPNKMFPQMIVLHISSYIWSCHILPYIALTTGCISKTKCIRKEINHYTHTEVLIPTHHTKILVHCRCGAANDNAGQPLFSTLQATTRGGRVIDDKPSASVLVGPAGSVRHVVHSRHQWIMVNDCSRLISTIIASDALSRKANAEIKGSQN